MVETQKSGTLLLGIVLGLLLAGVVGLLTWLIIAAGTVSQDDGTLEISLNEVEEILDLDDLDVNLDVEETNEAAEEGGETETLVVSEEKTEKIYAGYWEEWKSLEEPNFVLYEVPFSDFTAAKQIFVQKGSQVHLVLDDQVIYSKSGTNNVRTVYAYDPTTKESATLFSLGAKHRLGHAIAAADGKTFYYDDQCAATCAADDKSSVTTIKSYNLDTKKESTLFTEKGKWQGFKVLKALLNATTLLLGTGYEATEGPTYMSEFYTLDLISGTVTTVDIDSTTTSIAASPDGTQLAYVTFVYDENTEKSTSLVLVKSLTDGTVTVLQRGTDIRYWDLEWVDAGTLAVLTQEIETIRFELGYVITGKTSLQLLDIASKTSTPTTFADEPYLLSQAIDGQVLYNFKGALRAYDLKTQSSTVVLDREADTYWIVGVDE
jgi:hypothetical protein